MNSEYKHKFAAVVLAAGKGERMKSALPKVMHRLAGEPLIAHVLQSLDTLSPEKTVVVIAPGMDSVRAAALAENAHCAFAIQDKPLGTGHAVQQAATLLEGYNGAVIILYGDVPMLTTRTMRHMLQAAGQVDLVVLAMRPENPTGYGRMVITDEGQLVAIVEEKDASPEQKAISLCNAGAMALNAKHLQRLLSQLQTANAAKEYYLTDLVALANKEGLTCAALEAADPMETTGINTREQLAAAEDMMQQRLRARVMEQGATLVNSDSVFFSADTKLGTDVTVHPYVVFGPGVSVADNAEIRSFSHIEGATIGKGAVIGPFARLRPGSIIGEEAHVGNFVELKKTTLGKGAKANHLSYVGDAEVGEGVNIGAGTITCNYDGFGKYETKIGAGAFIGSNTSLVAPVTVGKGAIIGAGSVITEDVEADALAIARPPQVNKSAKAKEIRQRGKKKNG